MASRTQKSKRPPGREFIMVRVCDWVASILGSSLIIFANTAPMDFIPKMVTEYGAFAGLVVYLYAGDKKKAMELTST